jgi:hypothetical protein
VDARTLLAFIFCLPGFPFIFIIVIPMAYALEQVFKDEQCKPMLLKLADVAEFMP